MQRGSGGNWASSHIEALKRGETVQFRPRGRSMTGHIENGELVTVSPIKEAPPVGSIVLVKVRGVVYVHFLSAWKGDELKVENARGHVNGWTHRANLYGVVVKVEK